MCAVLSHEQPAQWRAGLGAVEPAAHARLGAALAARQPRGSPSPSVDSASESSLPSVSSSFFFSSSAAGSPGRSHPGSYPSSHPHSDHEHELEHEQEHDAHSRHHTRVHEQGLIIPSLTLPEALRRPTPFGQTLGELRVLVLGAQGAGKSFLTGLLLEDNEHVVDVGTWEDWHAGETVVGEAYAHGKVLRASTDWLEQNNTFGLERFEPTKNVEIVELPGYAHDTDGADLIARLKSIIEGPFRALHDVLHPDSDPSGVVASLLASPTSPLYTALIFLLPSPSTPLDKEIIQALSAYIPVIVLPRTRDSKAHPTLYPAHPSVSIPTSRLSAFRPHTAVALRTGLFYSPETVALLRSEAADRFLRWREVEKAVEGIWEGSLSRLWGRTGGERAADASSGGMKSKAESWSKAKWEAEWMEDHAQEVARRMREGARRAAAQRPRTGTMVPPLRMPQALPASVNTQSHAQGAAATGGDDTAVERSRTAPSPDADKQRYSAPPLARAPGASFDPLHLPSLLILTVSLLAPLRECIGAVVLRAAGTLRETRVQVALVGGFCVGVGVGVWAREW
ncbi:hypothetical protein BJ912DRAFT_907259 [Pholiota molesta]|nr:hypothetical protein BJ912DRAFT_907259 [Pholiota molesta]